MTWYFIVSAVMFVLTLLRAFAEIGAFAKKHPDLKFEKRSGLQNFCTWVRLIVIFLVPIVNVIAFFMVFFFFTEKDFSDACWKCVER